MLQNVTDPAGLMPVSWPGGGEMPEFPANRLLPETFEPGLQDLRPPNGSVEAWFSVYFLQQLPVWSARGRFLPPILLSAVQEWVSYRYG